MTEKHLAFSRCFQYSCFLFHGTEEVIDDAQDPFEKVDCINTYGSYNRTCKGNYVRPFQPYKDVNANLTKTNISPLTAQVSRDTQETVVKRNFYHVNLDIDSTGRVSNCSNSNLKGPLGLLRSMLVQITLFFFFIEYVLFTILTQCHFNTSRTTTQVPQTCTLEYVRNAYHQISRISSENEIDVIKNCEIV